MKDAIKLIHDGDTLALGGNVLHRAPMAAVRELARNKVSHLKIVKTAGAHDIDVLCAAGAVQSVDAGFVSYETKFGLANHYRKAVQSGEVKANEHACYTVICALRAAQMNVPFMPVHGLNTGDLLIENDYFIVVEDPFTGVPVTLVKSIVPDVAIIHVQECDEKGNAVIKGPKFEDVLISRAAKKVIITTEQFVSENKFRFANEEIDIPGFLVDAVVHAPKGASPGACFSRYDVEEKMLESFLSMKSSEELSSYLAQYEKQDNAINGRKLGHKW